MNRMAFCLILAVGLLFLGAFAPTGAKGEADQGEGKAAFEMYCLKCHDAQRSLSREKDQDGWEKTVERMSGYHQRLGGPIPEDAVGDIVRYLLQSAGGR